MLVWRGQVSYSSAAPHFSKYAWFAWLFMQISSSGNFQKLTNVTDTSWCRTITGIVTTPYTGTQNSVQHICTAHSFNFSLFVWNPQPSQSIYCFLGLCSPLFIPLFMNESILRQKVLSRSEAGRVSQLKLSSQPKENRHIWVNKNTANLCWVCHFSWKNKSHQPESAYTFSNQN